MSKQDLTTMRDKMIKENTFHPGQIVKWKDGLKNRRTSGLFIVMEVLEVPIIDPEKEPGSCYFREPLDLILGHTDTDGCFICFHCDSRRMQPAD